MKLVIISHTPHYTKGGNYLGWGPTINEINHLSKLFSKIYHIAPLYDDEKCPKSSLSYHSSKIKYIPIIPGGGKSILAKIKFLLSVPSNLKTIHRICNNIDFIHLRTPTNIALYVLPYLYFYSGKLRWVKYAGNWNQKNAPFSYEIQRLWLKKNLQRSFVTINGTWPNQKPHILSFENPCVTEIELNKTKNIIRKKKYNKKLNLCFVGRLEKEKGVSLLISALEKIKDKSFINTVYIVGEGPALNDNCYRASKINDVSIIFKGPISRMELNQIYEMSHIIIHPSLSEGFPKVLAEAAAYGCVPIVSKVGSIGQYINKRNGILLNNISSDAIITALISLEKNRKELQKKAFESYYLSKKFTYERYNRRILRLF